MQPDSGSSDLVSAVLHAARFPRARRALHELLDDSQSLRHDFSDLPQEILERVAYFTRPKDIITLRLTCKSFEKAAMHDFITHFIKCRRHVLSNYSLKTLINITAHPYFGKFVETVIFDTTSPFLFKDPRNFGTQYANSTNESLNFGDAGNLIGEAFDHWKKHGHAVTLGLTDRNPASFGLKELLSRPEAPLFTQDRLKFFLCILQVQADISRLNVSHFDIESIEASGRDQFNSSARLFVMSVVGVVAESTTRPSIRIKLTLENGSDVGLAWNRERRSLEIIGLTMWHHQFPTNFASNLFKDLTLMQEVKITDLTLSGCHVKKNVDYIKFMELLRTWLPTLEKVKLSGIVVEDDAKWSQVLHQMALAPRLTSFELSMLTRQISTFINHKKESATIVQIDGWSGRGDETLTDLGNLANLVEADELKWESLNDEDPQKWTYLMTGRNQRTEALNKKISEDKRLHDEASAKFAEDLEETITLLSRF